LRRSGEISASALALLSCHSQRESAVAVALAFLAVITSFSEEPAFLPVFVMQLHRGPCRKPINCW
jgi:hypothetical protein